ncbi:MAG: nucleotidyltransferase family protein [Armatimonadetes bacterium]|nr:nucleotidyltransferase family protein [Armatimonadota bacterium]
MKAMILAAGFGERLRPLTLATPKPLIPVGGVPNIHRILRLLEANGFRDIVVNLHHLGEKIQESVGDGAAFGVRVSYSPEKEILGTGGGIKGAQQLIGDETFLVINGDILISIALTDVVRFHREHGGAATLVVRDDPSLDGYGAIMVDSGGRVRDILRLVDRAPGLLPRLFTGIQVLEPIFFNYLPEPIPASTTRKAEEDVKKGLQVSPSALS